MNDSLVPEDTTVLIVDDTRQNLLLLDGILGSRGYRTRLAYDAAQALAAVDERLPDLVLLDIVMPGMDGYEVCRRLKQNQQTRRIPVLFISARDETMDKVKGFEAGGVDYITRPFEHEEVLARVQNHLALKASRDKLVEELLYSRQESRELHVELVASEARYRGIFDNATVGIFQIEEDGQITMVNHALCTMLGYQSPLELTRQNGGFYRQILADPAKSEELLQQLEHADIVRGFEILCRCRSGETIRASMSVHNVRDEAGALLYRQGTLEDTGERRQLEKYRLDNRPWPIVVQSLGGLELLLGGQPVQFASKAPKKPLQLLELLVIRGGRQVPEDWLAFALWPDSDGDAALRSLSTTIHRLRQLLMDKGVLIRRNCCLTVDRGRCWVDAWALEDELQGLSRLNNVDSIVAAADRVCRLYRGSFMPQSNLGETLSYRSRLFRRMIHVLAGAAKRLEGAGELQKARELVTTARYLVELDPDNQVERHFDDRDDFLAKIARNQ